MKRNDRLRRFVFVVLLAVGAPFDSMCADVWPSPGICFYIPPGNSWWSLPDSDKGTVLVDLGLLEAKRPSMYGLSLSLAASYYDEAMVGVYDDVSMRIQVGIANTHKFLLLGRGESRHPGGNGVHVGFLNVSSEGGHLQLGVFNWAYKSGVLQVGLYNSMDDNARGLQIGIVNEHGDDESTPFIGWCW